MKLKLREYIPYLFAFVFTFYGCPLFIGDTGTAMLILLMVVPFFILIASIMFGMTKKRIDIPFLILLEVCFIPSIFIYMNSSALIYTVFYGVLCIIGQVIGYFLGKSKQKTPHE
ncbi:hypothetical protein [Anaerorhabdus sp.]|uniref:hypothetical protein n=1 Tax=Anaerorhabdus sp. TaxID=1872524 RepID=UPI002FC84085